MDALPQDKGVVSRMDGVLDFAGCPSSLPCAVRFDPTCLEDTDEDGDELLVRRPLSRLKRSRDALAPSALESGSSNSERVFPTDAGSTVGSASTVAAAGSLAKSVGKRRGSAITGKTDTRFDAGNLRPKSTHAFGRTLPGELARYIIAAGVNCPRVFLRDCEDSRVSDVGTAALPGNGGSIPPVVSAGLYSGTRKAKRKRRKAWKEAGKLVLRGHASRYHPTHKQLAKVVAKCLPKHCVDEFVGAFGVKQHEESKPSPKVRIAGNPSARATGKVVPRDDETVIKTPVKMIDNALRKVFGDKFVTFKRCFVPADLYNHDVDGRTDSDLDIVVMDCILARTDKPPKVKRKQIAKLVDTPVKVLKCELDPSEVDENYISGDTQLAAGGNPLLPVCLKDDKYYRACVVMVPDAGVYYCHRERRMATAGVVSSHVPMDINWLRLRRHSTSTVNNWFNPGAYVWRMSDGDCNVWKWGIRRSATNLLPPGCVIPSLRDRTLPRAVHTTYQCTDEEGTCLAPDCVDGTNLSRAMDDEALFRMYRTAYMKSNSAKRGCRHYARGFLHENIDGSKTWIIDPQKVTEMDLQALAHIRYSGEKAAVHRVSTVQIRYLPHIIGKDCDQMLNQIHGHCRMVARRYGRGGKARAGKGDLGCMHPVGTHINTKGDMCQYVTSSGCEDLPILRAAVTACSRLAGVAVPGVLRVAQDLEDDAGMQRLPGMDGCDHFGHVTHTLDLSVNLSNASHYDVNDASQGFSIWTEDEPGTTKNWYFVLPNLVGTFPDSDREYKGIAIKLSHGVLVSWDGRLIRHCTSVKTRHAGNFFGTFFAAKTRVVKFGMRIARERYNAADTSQVETHARQEPEVSPEPAEGKVAAGMSGKKLDIIDNKKNDMTDVRKVPVVDVDEGSIVDTSEDEGKNSGEDDETIDDGIFVPADDIVSTGSRNKSDNDIRTIPDCSAGVHIATGTVGVTASTDTASSFRIPRKLAGTIPNQCQAN